MFSWKWNLTDIVQDKPVNVFSIFSCGGGSSMGYKRAGFNVIGNVEIDPKINAVYVRNLHPRFNFNEDARAFVNRSDLPSELYALDILDGSPPCTTFSMAGDREKSWGQTKKFAEGRQSQRLDDLFFIYLQIVEKLRPKVCVAENVEGLLRGNARGYVSEILDRFKELGYECQVFLLSSKFMDVPQNRRRVFFIANRMGFPKLKLSFNEKPICFGEVKAPHGRPFTKEDSLFKKILDRMTGKPHDIQDARKDGRTGGFSNCIFYDDLVPDTLTAASSYYRADERSYLSQEDFRNISTFPQDYDFCGVNVQYVCGMSVPPNMMAHIATQIWSQWLTCIKNTHD